MSGSKSKFMLMMPVVVWISKKFGAKSHNGPSLLPDWASTVCLFSQPVTDSKAGLWDVFDIAGRISARKSYEMVPGMAEHGRGKTCVGSTLLTGLSEGGSA